MKKRIFCLILCLALLIGILPAGAFALTTAAADTGAAETGGIEEGTNDGTDPNNPIMITDFDSLQRLVGTQRTGHPTLYLKLAKDITYNGLDGGLYSKDGGLTTNGCDIDLDLAGYTISYTAEKTFFIRGQNGRITIRDSRRYDPDKHTLRDGRIEFDTRLGDIRQAMIGREHGSWDHTYMMQGDITLIGGEIVSKNDGRADSADAFLDGYSSDDYGYYSCGGNLKMYGGSIEADRPVWLSYGSADSELSGGSLKVKRDLGIQIDTQAFLPTVSQVTVLNVSDNSKIVGFKTLFGDTYTKNHSKDQAFSNFCSMFPSSTRSFIDSELQENAYSGTAKPVNMNGCYVILGPSISKKYVLYPSEIISELDVTIPAPSAGGYPKYNASVPSNAEYRIENYSNDASWVNGVYWKGPDGKGMTPNVSTFESGRKYTVFIRVEIKDWFTHLFNNVDRMEVSVNGNKASLTKTSDRVYQVGFAFIVGRTPVGTINITASIPKAGESPSYTSSVPSGKGYRIQIYTSGTCKNGMRYETVIGGSSIDSGYKFIAGTRYRLFFYMEITDQNWYYLTDPISITATVNGDKAYFYSDEGGGEFVIRYDFTVPTPNVINTMSAAITAPAVGDSPSFSATVPSGKGYKIENYNNDVWMNGVNWVDENGNDLATDYKFRNGKAYTVNISLVPTDPTKYMFGDRKSLTATVNDCKADTALYQNSANCVISFTFPALDDSVISRLTITVEEPTAGAKPNYNAVIPFGKGYKFDDFVGEYWKHGVMWEDKHGENPTVFEAGEQYKVYIDLELTDKSHYSFADAENMTATINGNPATFYKGTTGDYIVHYTFTCEEDHNIELTVGDINLDNSVTNKDALILDRKLAKWAGYDDKIKIKTLADLNRDENITNKDSLILNRYLAKWTGYDKYIIKISYNDTVVI